MDGRNFWQIRSPHSAPPRCGPLQIGLAHFNRFAFCLGLAGLVLIAGVLWVRQNVDGQIRDQVNHALNRALAEYGLRAELDDAHFLPGEGILLRGLTIADTNQVHLSVDRIFVRGQVGWHQLILSQIVPEAIEVRGAKLVCVRNVSGIWNFQPWLQRLAERRSPREFEIIPVQLRQCQVEVRVEGPRHTLAYTLRDLSLAALPRTAPAATAIPPLGTSEVLSERWLDIQGGLTANGVQQISFQVKWEPQAQRWSAAVAAAAATLDSKMFTAATELVGEPIKLNTAFRGSLDLQCTARGTFSPWAVSAFQLDGSLQDCEISDPAIPTALRQAQAKFRLTPTSIDVWDASARSDEGSFACQFHRDGIWDGPWRWVGQCRQVRIDAAIAQRLPPNLLTMFKTWQPAGLVDLEFDLTQTRERLIPQVHAGILDASFEFDKFPYRIEHCVGDLVWQDDHCKFGIRALDDDRIVTIDGDVLQPGKDFTGAINIQVDGLLPLDAKLFRALEAQPRAAEVVHKFHPTGHIRFAGRIQRDDPRQPLAAKDYHVTLVNCSVRHELFDYPFYDVNGELRLQNDRVDVLEVSGVHGNGSVQCRGAWSKSAGLDLQFSARSVSLDDQLLAALPPQARARWSELRPTGVVDLISVHMQQPQPETATRIEVAAELLGSSEPRRNAVSIRPTWFDYAIHDLAGHVHIDTGTIALQGMRGRHGDTWFSCDGQGQYEGSTWNLELSRIYVGGVQPNEELLRALPPALANAARKLSLTGLMNVSGTAVVRSPQSPASEGVEPALVHRGRQGYVGWNAPAAAQPAPSAPPTSAGGSASARMLFGNVALQWDLRIDFDNLQTNVGTPIDSICGYATLQGEVQPERFHCRGELNLDSAMIAHTQLTQIQGPIYVDDQAVLLGSRAQAGDSAATPRSLASQFCGGTLLLDGHMDLRDQYPFVLEAQLQRCDMGSISEELIPKRKSLLGLGYAKVRLAGDTSGRHTWRGAGEIYLRGARIEVPIMSALGQVLRETELDRTVFDESNIAFEIRGEDIDLNQIEMLGSPISLIGNGRVNHNREIDLDFYTILGRNRIRIPIVTDLYTASSQQFLHIKVDGDLDNPRTHKTVLPGINEPLQRLAADLEPRTGQ